MGLIVVRPALISLKPNVGFDISDIGESGIKHGTSGGG